MMETREIHIQKPEEQELAHKIAEQARLESDLAERELLLTNLRAELASFEQRYLREVGSLYAGLDELQAQLAERIAREQPGNERAQHAAREARRRANETRFVADVPDGQGAKRFEPTAELKRLYREVARRVHPDLTSEREDRARRQELMAEANRAYAEGDETRLEKVFLQYESSPEAVQGEGTGADLVRVIRKISQVKNRLTEIEAETQQILRSDIYQLRSRVEEAARHDRDVLMEMREKVEQQIAQMKEKLSRPGKSAP